MTDQVSEMDDQELLLAEMYDSRINRYSLHATKLTKLRVISKDTLKKNMNGTLL